MRTDVTISVNKPIRDTLECLFIIFNMFWHKATLVEYPVRSRSQKLTCDTCLITFSIGQVF